MTYTSVSFLLFFIITIIAYFVVPKKMQWGVTLTASVLFYLCASVKAFVFLFAVTLITFGAGIILGGQNTQLNEALQQKGGGDEATKQSKKTLKATFKRRKKRVTAICLVLVLGLLVTLKYYDILAPNINSLLNRELLPSLHILLPLGISFYIFQSAGYVIDVYRGKIEPDKNFLQFALFVSYFPQIIQGPIGRYDRLAHQLYEYHPWDCSRVKYGIQLALWGLFKKMVIADRAAVLVNEVFGNYENYGGALLFISILFYSIQIYCDFSGGIDVSRGIAQVMGIQLSQNFNQPFFATSVADFWRRWHMTLGTWLKDYLFYPLTLSKPMTAVSRIARSLFGNRIGKLIPVCASTFIIYIVVGLWHGSSLKYVAFGLYNGTIITISLLFEMLFGKLGPRLGMRPEQKAWRYLSIFRTLFLVCIGRYFTRAATLLTALRMLKKTFMNPVTTQLTSGVMMRLGLTMADYILLLLALAILFVVEYYNERQISVRTALENKNATVQIMALLIGLCAIVFFGIYSGNYVATGFIYAQY